MKIWSYESISSIHLELSSKCNAACPGCARFLQNSPLVDPSLIQTEVTYDNFVKWFPEEILKNIYNWVICGVFGDPLACKDLYKILEYICKHSPGNIQLNTNGGLRNTSTYTKIGNLFATRTSYNGIVPHRVVVFSIDGLEQTNHIYRRNVVWNKLWANLMAYVETGAEAHWDFLQFKHNVHQIEEAKSIAKKYNINFVLKNPFGVDKTAMPVYNEALELDYIIEHATDNGYPPYIPASADYIAPDPAPINSSGCISCMSVRNAPYPYETKTVIEIFVNALGQVLPCCFVGNRMFIRHMSDAIQTQKIQSLVGSKNNLHTNSLQEILDSNVLDVWSNSWEEKTISVCWNQCGSSDNKERIIDILFKDAK